MFQILSTFFKIPEIHIPVVRFPSAKDLQEAGAKGQTSTSEFHCVNGVCTEKTLTSTFGAPSTTN